MENIADKIFIEILSEKSVELTYDQEQKFRKACKKSIDENADLNYHEQKSAARIYLNFILDFPDMTL